MMALALIAWGLKRRWIRPGFSPYARIVSPRALSRTADCTISELIAGEYDKFTPTETETLGDCGCLCRPHQHMLNPAFAGKKEEQCCRA